MKNPDAPAVRGKAEEALAYLLLPKTFSTTFITGTLKFFSSLQ
jgi:hypothetical protein